MAPTLNNPTPGHLLGETRGDNGMTLRQTAALAAHQGLLASGEHNGFDDSAAPQKVARKAVTFADALLEELAK